MTKATLFRPDPYITVTHQGWSVSLGVRVKDIGATIGTEVYLLSTEERIAAYRPGTRYGSYAQDLAAEMVNEAAQNLDKGKPMTFGEFLMDLSSLIRNHPDVSGSPWNPDEWPGEDW
ncbi:hypothetical protein SEA_IBANTIK_49 [Streptomyces phage Ibantik]|uniref:Uncharacterized protein n=1 Tax=Streptomyces phage Ibantik TaxID=2182397 RepID=A0A2U8UNT1_9CAUD|nr:hypothetical protein QEH36_gp049 [Streptomyces phage Ibantik]AWN05273.1 hypothetical protein SEA_IBANTIK_49 [Streptomyces phage Ibantik]